MERSKTKKKHSNMDFSILVTVLALCAIGLVMVFSASYYYALEKWGDALLYVRKQSIYLALSIPVMLLLTRIDYKVLEKLKTPGLLLSVALLIAVLFFGKEANGAKRWLIIAGQSIQPSEVAKFGMILYMCSFMSSKQHLMKDFVKGLVPMLMVMGLICALVMAQPNMSMAVIIGMMGIDAQDEHRPLPAPSDLSDLSDLSDGHPAAPDSRLRTPDSRLRTPDSLTHGRGAAWRRLSDSSTYRA